MGVLVFALVVVAEGEIRVVEEDALRLAGEGAAEVGTRVVVMQGTEGVAPLVGTTSTLGHEGTCTCSVGC